MTTDTKFVLTRRSSSVMGRLRRRAFRALPLLVWSGAIVLVCALVRDRMPAAPVKAVAETLRYSVISPLDGEIVALAVRERQTVECGQILAQVHDESIRLLLSSARFELDRLRAELRSVEVQTENERVLDQYDREVDRSSELRRLFRDVETARLDALDTRAAIEESRARQDGIAIELQRLMQLEEGITSGTELTLLRTEFDAVKNRVAGLQTVLAGHEERVRAGNERIAGFQTKSEALASGHDALLDPFRWQIRVQEIEVEQAALALSQSRLVAPAAGVVETIYFRKGERLTAGTILLTVVDPRSPGIVAYVPEQLRGSVKRGAPVELERPDAPGILLRSKIADISPAMTLVPPRLWTDPRVEEWALAVYLEPTGDELLPGQKVFVRWR